MVATCDASEDTRSALFESGLPLLQRALELQQEAMTQGICLLFDWQQLVGALAASSYNSLAVAVSVVDDFPIQALILARAVFEAILTADYITANPSDQHLWFEHVYDHDA